MIEFTFQIRKEIDKPFFNTFLTHGGYRHTQMGFLFFRLFIDVVLLKEKKRNAKSS